MKHLILKALCIIGSAAVVAGCSGGKSAKEKAAEEAAAEKAKQDSIAAVRMQEKQKAAEAEIALLPDEPIFDIETNLGTIKVKLYKKTPKHRANFEKLALSGFYDSLLFHRVINGFMIQGGDPNTRDTSLVDKYGQGGPGYTIPAEFVPEYKHKKGALAAARRGDTANPKKESSGSQFYIVQDENTCAQLDGEYTVFGETVEGMKVIDKIAAVATDKRDRPLNDVRIIRIVLDPQTKAQEAQAAASSSEAASDKADDSETKFR